MANEINYIQRVEILGLWDRFDIDWKLNPDVNILAGINGSGKTTILYYIYGSIRSDNVHSLYQAMMKEIKISFDNKKFIHNKYESGSSKDGIDIDRSSIQDLKMTLGKLNEKINIATISTFDNSLKSSEAVKKLSDNNVKTELDWEIYHLQNKYVDYQLNISKKKDVVIYETPNAIKEEFEKIKYPQTRFLEIVDNLFAETGKEINKNKNQIEFLLGDKEITPYQLSSGEKQLLIILLTVLIQDNKPSILFMDEPEISLHIDWQRKIIKYIRELNPNVQLIIATHSPAIIMEGWLDKVFELGDIIVRDSATS